MDEGRDVVSLLRSLEHRTAARRQYLADHRRLEAMSRELYDRGEVREGDRHHYWALVLLHAAESELREPRA